MIAPRRASSLALVAANLVPVGGVLIGVWSVFEIVLLYWAENIIVGLFQVLRMGAVFVLRLHWLMPLMIPFFCLHYGGFALGHGSFVVLVLAPPALRDPELNGAVGLLLATDGLLWAVLGLVASHGLSFVLHFLRGGEWRHVSPSMLMVQPYGRVVVLTLVVVLGSWITLSLGEPMAALLVLVALKIAADLLTHRAAHPAPGEVQPVFSPGRPAPAP